MSNSARWPRGGGGSNEIVKSLRLLMLAVLASVSAHQLIVAGDVDARLKHDDQPPLELERPATERNQN